MLKKLFTLIYQDMLMTFRQAFSWLTPAIFFVLVVAFFPLALGSDNALLAQIGPGIIWISALLAILISISNLFRSDLAEGTLDLFILSGHSLTAIVFCKVISHWLTTCLPLILISPLLGLLLNLSFHQDLLLMVSLLLGTPVLILIGAIGSALTVGVRQGGLLLPILIMPLYIPILIFGTGILMSDDLSKINSGFALIGAFLFLTIAFAPFLTGLALRIGVNQ